MRGTRAGLDPKTSVAVEICSRAPSRVPTISGLTPSSRTLTAEHGCTRLNTHPPSHPPLRLPLYAYRYTYRYNCSWGQSEEEADSRLLAELHAAYGKGGHPSYALPRLHATSCFAVRHYAGEVMYEVRGFSSKNRETLSDDLQVGW